MERRGGRSCRSATGGRINIFRGSSVFSAPRPHDAPSSSIRSVGINRSCAGSSGPNHAAETLLSLSRPSYNGKTHPKNELVNFASPVITQTTVHLSVFLSKTSLLGTWNN